MTPDLEQDLRTAYAGMAERAAKAEAEVERLQVSAECAREDALVAYTARKDLEAVVEEQATELGRLRDVVIQDGEEKDGMIRRLVAACDAVKRHGNLCVHTAHWDSTGRSGAGCPVCIEQRKAADAIHAVLPEAREMIGDKRPKGDN